MTCSSLRSLRRGFTLVELLVVIAIIGVLVALLLPAVQSARESARRMQCANNLKQLALGMQMHHDTYLKLPTGGDNAAGVKYLIGWPAAIFPFIEQKPLRDQIEASTANALLNVMPWRFMTAPHNGASTMYTSPIKAFMCPSSELGKRSPDAWNSTDPNVNAVNQGPLHYRANGGSATSELVQGGAVLGDHKVVIVAMADNASLLPEQRSPTPPSIVPDKYTSLATSDLTAKVENKENTINFDLQGDK